MSDNEIKIDEQTLSKSDEVLVEKRAIDDVVLPEYSYWVQQEPLDYNLLRNKPANLSSDEFLLIWA